jgi:predicted O-linked N-acetylglucosamine transferase (SPINDLY family)
MGLLDWAGQLRSKASAPKDEKFSRRGVEAIANGKFFAAAEEFRAAVEANPHHAPHHINLAYALIQRGDDKAAQEPLQRAIELDPQSFDAHYMFAGVKEKVGEPDEALRLLRVAVRLDPDSTHAQSDLCRCLLGAGDLTGAHAAILDALQRRPDDPGLSLAMGNVCMAMGNADEAISHIDRVLASRGDSPHILVNKGAALRMKNQTDEALQCFDKALQIDTGFAGAHLNIGVTFQGLERHAQAIEAFERLVALEPENADAHDALGCAQLNAGRIDQSIASHRMALELDSDRAGTHVNLGLALSERGDTHGAIATYRDGLAVKELETLHQNLGNALLTLGSVHEATASFERACELGPDNLTNRINLANAYAARGLVDRALVEYRHAIERSPDRVVGRSNMLFYLSTSGAPAVEYLAEARRFDESLKRVALPALDLRGQSERRPLRVGIVSGDLRHHPVGFFIEGILEKLDRGVLEVHAYTTIARVDPVTVRLQSLCAHWTLLKGIGDDEAARRIRDDGIDILIDLSGHTGDNRLGVFARRPAPLQVSWLGYWASTGLSSIDYVLADALCVPPGEEDCFVETVWRLPDTRLCFTPPKDAPDITPLPALQDGRITFGSFQRISKMTDEVLAVWGRIFDAVPGASLLIRSAQTGRSEQVEELLVRLKSVGIAPERVMVLGPVLHGEYLQTYQRVDIVLDTFPFPGGTTTCEGLWMGVPTLTLDGDSMISRQGAAMMTAAGLRDWVADTPETYIAKAVLFASDPAALAALRSGMRQRLLASPLFDVERFARHFENALTAMWRDKVRSSESKA